MLDPNNKFIQPLIQRAQTKVYNSSYSADQEITSQKGNRNLINQTLYSIKFGQMHTIQRFTMFMEAFIFYKKVQQASPWETQARKFTGFDHGNNLCRLLILVINQNNYNFFMPFEAAEKGLWAMASLWIINFGRNFLTNFRLKKILKFRTRSPNFSFSLPRL